MSFVKNFPNFFEFVITPVHPTRISRRSGSRPDRYVPFKLQQKCLGVKLKMAPGHKGRDVVSPAFHLLNGQYGIGEGKGVKIEEILGMERRRVYKNSFGLPSISKLGIGPG